MDIAHQRELARLLATLRRERRPQSGLDQRLVPPDKATAYRVAGMVAEELGWEVVGWKIAGMKEGLQRQLRTDSPIYGRVFAPIMESPASVEHAKLCSPIPEVEYQARLGVDLPPREKSYTLAEVTERSCRCIRESNSPNAASSTTPRFRRCPRSSPMAREAASSSAAPRSPIGRRATSPGRKCR
ncbi:hypothetical protein [Bradyrhizobium sp. AZCC 1721]|uniref:hypothetical protein n=1 Tax=Bradyrhizobium sp. AZCC 1721 TaxID=3117016 RepID=UPI002FF23509